tara:strand:- start:1097 stop:2842 length:1746 start_codon:yes stop_codon:yes gene_type:complete
MEKITIIYKYIFNQINKDFRFKFYVLIFIMLFAGFLEIGSIASLVPFLQKILFVQEEGRLIFFDTFFNDFRFYRENRFSFITFIFISFILTSLTIRLITLKLVINFTKIIGHYFATRVVSKILDLNYIDFTKENSSKFVTILETKIDRLMESAYHGLEILSSFIILLFIFTALAFVNIKITLLIFIFLFLCYLLMFKRYKNNMVKMGIAYGKGLSNRVKIVQEIFGSFRLLKIDQTNSKVFFNNQFLKYDYDIRSSQAKLGFLGTFPRYLIEGIAIVVIAISAFILIRYNIFNQETVILSLGVVGFTAQRLLPMIQRIYFSCSYIVGNKEAAYDAIEILLSKDNNENLRDIKEFKFSKTLIMKNVDFTYQSKKEKKIFNNINLEIKKNSRVCILGKTGSGKSTFVDLIVGLLKPDTGKVLVDDNNIQDVMRSWQSQIAYVPQSTFLTDTSILENIAFGVDFKKIDISRAENAIKIAGLKDMIDELPEKLLTKIGERGILMSGGQIQRLGLARAFYRNFEMLILDESTNALDAYTEELIYSNIKKEFSDKTIIIITHKPSLSKNSDTVIKIDQGKVEIIKNN